MLVKSSTLFAIVLVTLTSVAKAEKDLDKFQGTWEVVSAARGGDKAPAERLKRMQIVIKDKTMEIRMGDRVVETATIEIDSSKDPKTIDFQPKDREERKVEQPSHGIYQFEGDTLKLCWRKRGGERPKEFATKADERGLVLMVLKRKKE